MTKREIEKIYLLEIDSKKDFEKPFNMIATKAYHQLGDISRDLTEEDLEEDLEENLSYISSETKNYYIGMWLTGFGFINVLFPKESTRDLTEEEFKKLNKFSYNINSTNYGKYQLTKRQEVINENS